MHMRSESTVVILSVSLSACPGLNSLLESLFGLPQPDSSCTFHAPRMHEELHDYGIYT